MCVCEREREREVESVCIGGECVSGSKIIRKPVTEVRIPSLQSEVKSRVKLPLSSTFLSEYRQVLPTLNLTPLASELRLAFINVFEHKVTGGATVTSKSDNDQNS